MSKRILVIEDQEDNRRILRHLLGSVHYEVLEAVTGENGVALAERERPELILMDIQLPGLDGYEATRPVKGNPDLRHIPIIVVTAKTDPRDVVAGLEAGGDEYLIKPVDQAALVARVKSMLRIKNLHDTVEGLAAERAEGNMKLERRVEEQVAELEQLGRLKLFFSPQVAELIVAGGADDPLTTHRREVTVVFVDLWRFTEFAETAEPEEVMAVLREFHAEMGKLILEHEGTPERFPGDGMMIFFNDPVPVPDPAERAIRMAGAMRERVRHLAAGWQKRGYDLALGVGIAQGYATIGAIGTVTNLAARLCGEAQAGQILVSSRVAGVLEGLIEFEEVGRLTLKGFLKPVPTFNAVGPRARPS